MNLYSFLVTIAAAVPSFQSTQNSEPEPQTRPSFVVQFDEKSLQNLKARYPLGRDFRLVKGRNGRPAAQFLGVDKPSAIQIPNRPEMQFSGAMTIDVWVRTDSSLAQDAFGKPANFGGQALLAKSHEKNGFQLLVGMYKGQLSAVLGSYDDTWTHVSCHQSKPWPEIPITTWYRLTYVADSRSGFRFYINKTLIYECLNSRPSFAAANQQDLFIGQLKGGWYPFYGTIQDLHFYPLALSDKQIKALID